MERQYFGIEIAQSVLPLDDWPKGHLLAICTFFESLRDQKEVMLGYAGVKTDLSFDVNVVEIWYNIALDRRIIAEMDEVGKTLGFQRHKSRLIHASLEEIDALEGDLILKGEFPFISPRSNGWVSRNGANGKH